MLGVLKSLTMTAPPKCSNHLLFLRRFQNWLMTRIVFAACGIWSMGLSHIMLSQATGIEVVVDTAFYGPNTPTPDDTFDPEGILDGYVSYLVYVTMTHPTDALSAVFSDAEFYPDGGALGIDAECGCFNPISESMVLGANNSSLLWELDPMLEYDTYFTIGKDRTDMPGVDAAWVSDPDVSGNSICSSATEDGAFYVLGTPENAIAGDDLRVLVARVTTCGDWSLNMDVQVFPEGNQSAVDLYFLDADGEGTIEVIDPCDGYALGQAEVEGNVISCAGSLADVSLQMLGMDADNTLYQLVSSVDNFETESLVGVYSNNEFSQLDNGEYRVYVEDGFGCRDTTSFAVTTADDSGFPVQVSRHQSAFLGAANLQDTLYGEDGVGFPMLAWAEREEGVPFFWQEEQVDEVFVEGCHEGGIRLSRNPLSSMQTDTVFFEISGSALMGFDYEASLHQIVLPPGVTDTLVSLNIVNDDSAEGHEDLLLTQSIVNGCDDTLQSHWRIVIVDSIPLLANPANQDCLGSDDADLIRFEEVSGFGPLLFEWNTWPLDSNMSGVVINSAIEALFPVVDAQGVALPPQHITLTLTDQCAQSISFEQQIQRMRLSPGAWCIDSTFVFPAINGNEPVSDILFDGESLLNSESLEDTLEIHATAFGDLWVLDSISTGSFDWTGALTLIDSCGRSSMATYFIVEYACTEGCTNETACNYFGDAGIEDGSCEFPGDACENEAGGSEDWVLDGECDCVPETSLLSSLKPQFHVFPNPNDGQFRIQTNVEQGRIRLFAADGRLVHEIWAQGLSRGHNLHLPLSDGMYVLEFTTGNRRMVTRLAVQ